MEQVVREIRCSSLDRYMKCPGFAQMTDLPPNEGGPAAEEGTAAGELLQAMLEQRTLTPKVNPSAANGVRFDNDMYFHLGPIAQEILNKNVQVYCEQRVDWTPCPGMVIRGQFDISYQIGDTLYIEDLKYGYKIVNVKENWQLLGYAIGKALQLKELPTYIEFAIHQPRPHHEEGNSRRWKIGMSEIGEYFNQIAKQMTLISQGSRELVTGPQCKYCPAAGERCPAVNRALYEGVDQVMNDFTQDSLTDSDISSQLTLLSRMLEIVKIKYDALEQLACSRLKEGKVINGYGLEEKYGDRSWNPDVTPEAIEILTGKSIFEQIMLSPAKAEKMGVPKSLVQGLVTRKFVGLKIKRKDLTMDAEKAFGKK